MASESLLPSSISTVGVSTAASGVSPTSPTESIVVEIGPEYGKIVINNGCSEDLVVISTGAWPLGGNRTKIDDTSPIIAPHNGSWNAWQEDIQYTIASGASYNESFRATCPNIEGAEEYCADYDKLRGQGVSLKIFTPANPSEALQFEYALVQNQLDELPYHTLNYDVSLPGCADPLDHVLLYGISFNTENHREITDQSMSAEDRKHKVDLCPGYKGGLRVSFKAEEGCDGDVCEPIDCSEDDWCKIIFFERTRDGEPSLSCGGEFRGKVILDLCVANAGANINTEAGSR
ncbi:hypothetical protein AG0111_0g7787 [Alternaria gaisen]|uniref:Uncharacterized protein n=1 Tax=Alternaria gaisen TaxID=167740 RepID=A0ACB6FJ35_9PLEO|nr:hypothetical protein AG0111_0g7787 [Alternaria gaisen]